MHIAIIIMAVLLVMPSFATPLRNPSFEMIPGPVVGQGILPSDWIQLAPSPGADTYSNDGSYGVLPGAFGNFPGITAHDGIRWVAGGGGDIPAAPAPEVFGQMLTSPLISGQAARVRRSCAASCAKSGLPTPPT